MRPTRTDANPVSRDRLLDEDAKTELDAPYALMKDVRLQHHLDEHTPACGLHLIYHSVSVVLVTPDVLLP